MKIQDYRFIYSKAATVFTTIILAESSSRYASIGARPSHMLTRSHHFFLLQLTRDHIENFNSREQNSIYKLKLIIETDDLVLRLPVHLSSVKSLC